MTKPSREALSLSHKALRCLIVLNWAFGAGILCLLIWTLFAPAYVAGALGVSNEPRVILGMRLIMVIGIAVTPVANVVFTRLLAIVQTVRDGTPFTVRNATRLRTIGGALVVLELSRFLVVAVAPLVSTPAHPFDMDLNISVTGWLAVLLLFVLAGVFEHGAQMREELEATI